MEFWQKILIGIWGILGFIGFLEGYRISSVKKQNLKWCGPFTLFGAFVWADMVIFGIFWAMASAVLLLINNWILFPVTLSVFWTVRSLGEVNYWFNQQFSTIVRYSFKDNRWLMRIFNDDYTVWFVIQIIMQCVAVISLLFSIYFIKLWLG